ncbi:MAG: periplasmic heavy metal sensor [Flavobacteriales bacterium]|nr:periplasmic heavy metal sensor [Flavobacteriales bacterium]
MKKLMATLGVLTLLVGTGFAQDKTQAVGSHPQQRFERGGKQEKMMAEIPNLTEEQKTQIKAIRDENRKRMEPQRKEMKSIHEKLAELKKAEQPNMQEINQLIDKSAVIKAEMEKSRTMSEMKVRGVLTPEQVKVMDQKMQERKDMREKQHMERKQMQAPK